jgi:hypothetical protein
MKQLRALTTILFLLAALRLTAQVVPPQIAYIIPDIGTPGMNTYVELIAPVDRFGKFGTSDGIFPASALQIKLVNAADSNRVIVSPCVASWDGRMLSCQFFVRPGADQDQGGER